MGRASGLEYVKYGSWDGSRVVYRYSPPGHPPGLHHPGYTPAQARRSIRCGTAVHGYVGGANSAVGLKSVDQLSLGTQISDIRDMTEVYNVATAGNPNDHKYILGND